MFGKVIVSPSKSIAEKLERYKTREALKNWEVVLLKSNVKISKNLKGIFNIFEENLEFEITKDFGMDVNEVQGFKANLKEGGYAIFSSSINGIGASIWYKERFFSIEPLGEGVYFVSETDMNIIKGKENSEDFIGANQLSKNVQQIASVSSTLTAADVTVFVAYTPAVAQSYNIFIFLNQCQNIIDDIFSSSMIASTINIVGHQQLSYTESGNAVTDINRFMTNGDGYMDEILGLRNQYEADICVLLVNTLNMKGYAGAIGAVFEDAFCVVRANAAVSDYTFPHELGHLFGSRHDNDSGTDPFEYAHGYKSKGVLEQYDISEKKYQTVMATDAGYLRIPYFSNPNIQDDDDNPMGTVDINYCASAIDNYASNLALLEPHYFTTSGTMSADEWWSGTINIIGNVTIPNNVTLTIGFGTTINFSNNSSLIVNGTLDVNGTSSNKVTFDFVSSSGNGIEIYDNATADISNAIIKNANKGLYINEGYANVSNTDFINCNYGLSFYRTNYASSQPDITNCNIYKSSYDDSGTGIYLKYSSPIILNTEIYNYYTGIRTIYNSSPLLGHYTANGNNNLHNNFKNIHAFSNSNPFLGTISYGGYNTLRYYTNNNIVALANCNINAENNYWGSTTTSTIASGLSIGTGCSVDFEPFLTWNPNGNIALPPAKLSANLPPSITSVATDLISVHDLILRDKLEEALTLCNSFISESKETSTLLYAIDLLWQIERKMKQQKGKSNIDLFAELRTNSKNELVAGYSNLIAAVGEQSDRIISLDNVLSNYGSLDIIEKGVIYSKLLYYLNEEENREKAEGEYKILKEKYPNAPITEEALFALNSGNIQKGQDNFNEKSDTALDEKSTDFTLFENYPNPFNPTTQISYQIPKDEFVNLVIYNSLGQVISTLVNEHKPSGKYSVQFNASNLPSGVYFYKIESGSFSKVNKMLLLR